MSRQMSPRRRHRSFDRHWSYPNPAARIGQLLGRTRAAQSLLQLIADGDPNGVLHWMYGHEGPFELFNLLQLGLGGRPPEEDPFLRFDEVPVATLTYFDGPGTTDTLYARRTGKGFEYRVWFDGSGDWVEEFTTDRPLTQTEVRRLFDEPSWLEGDISVDVEVEINAPARNPWDPDARPARFGGWDGSIVVESDKPAACPVCGYDLNHPAGDFCAHYLGSPDLTEQAGYWAGGPAICELGEAIRELEAAAADVPEGRWARFLKAEVPSHLRAAVDTACRGGWDRDWEAYLGDLLSASPTYLGGYGMEKTMMPAESWEVHWDATAGTRARVLDRQFKEDRRAIRVATKAAQALARKLPD